MSFPFLFNSMYRSLMIMLQNLGRCILVHLTVPLLVDSSQLSAVVTLLYLLLPGPSNHTDGLEHPFDGQGIPGSVLESWTPD